jgi:predicted pyridoxine 5'-phosphate oxidase superfamily flavin-nucleotide-binding protein
MKADDPAVREILSRSMVVCIATLSPHGRPSIHPIYFILNNGKIWIGTAVWTIAARNAKANPQVSLLFNVEQAPEDRRVLRVSGQAIIRIDSEIKHAYSLGVARKYILKPKALANWLTHLHRVWLRRYYTAQSREKGQMCVIEVTPTQFELLQDD